MATVVGGPLAVLELQSGGSSARYGVDVTGVSIGRDPACSIVVSDPSVSRTHAKLSFDSGLFFVEDCSSKNGVFLNRKRVYGKVELEDGDLITIGPAVFRFSHQQRVQAGLLDATIIGGTRPIPQRLDKRVIVAAHKIWWARRRWIPWAIVAALCVAGIFVLGKVRARMEYDSLSPVQKLYADERGERPATEWFTGLTRIARTSFNELLHDPDSLELVEVSDVEPCPEAPVYWQQAVRYRAKNTAGTRELHTKTFYFQHGARVNENSGEFGIWMSYGKPPAWGQPSPTTAWSKRDRDEIMLENDRLRRAAGR